MEAERRRTVRKSFLLNATLLKAQGFPIGQARVHNVSTSGLMASTMVRLKDGDRLLVEIRSLGEIWGNVAWVRNDRFGMTFDQPIVLTDLDRPERSDPTKSIASTLRPLPQIKHVSPGHWEVER